MVDKTTARTLTNQTLTHKMTLTKVDGNINPGLGKRQIFGVYVCVKRRAVKHVAFTCSHQQLGVFLILYELYEA